jgi:hypothetical protein
MRTRFQQTDCARKRIRLTSWPLLDCSTVHTLPLGIWKQFIPCDNDTQVSVGYSAMNVQVKLNNILQWMDKVELFVAGKT